MQFGIVNTIHATKADAFYFITNFSTVLEMCLRMPKTLTPYC